MLHTCPSLLQFPDAKCGEWFGYLTQEGKVALDFKGGPFKGTSVGLTKQQKHNLGLLSRIIVLDFSPSGFFHVPRCLYMCERILDDLLADKDWTLLRECL